MPLKLQTYSPQKQNEAGLAKQHLRILRTYALKNHIKSLWITADGLQHQFASSYYDLSLLPRRWILCFYERTSWGFAYRFNHLVSR